MIWSDLVLKTDKANIVRTWNKENLKSAFITLFQAKFVGVPSEPAKFK